MDVFVFVGGYMGFYLIGTHINKHATGEWVYPICDDITNEHGDLGRNIFFGALVTIISVFAKAGLTIVNMRARPKLRKKT